MKDEKDNISEIDKLIFILDHLEKNSKEEKKIKEFARIKQKLFEEKKNSNK